MKQMLKIELERAFKSAGLKVSLLIGIVISTLHFFQKVLPTALDPLHFYKTGNLETVANVNNMWMAMGEGWHYTLYVRLIPLLAVVPYAVTYYTDYKKGIVKNYYTRTKKINYISAKYIAVFLTGGSGGALALGVANEVWMMENSIYSILSPEGFASILWKDSKKAKEAAEIMKLTAADLYELGIIEKVIPEYPVINENNIKRVTLYMKRMICDFMYRYIDMDKEELARQRYNRFRKM